MKINTTMVKSFKVRVLIVDEHPLFSLGLSYMFKNNPGYIVVGEAASAESALKLAEKEEPQLVIMEFNFGEENGLDLIAKLKSLYPEIVILVLSMQDERFYSERILRLGARGYIMKNAPVNEVIEAIKTVMAGKVYLSESEKYRIFEAITVEGSGSESNMGDNARGNNDRSDNARSYTRSNARIDNARSNNARGGIARSESAEEVNTIGKNERASMMLKLTDKELEILSLIGRGYNLVEVASKISLSKKTVETHKEHIKRKLQCGTSLELRQFAIEWTNRIAYSST